MSERNPAARCGACRFFCADPRAIEAAVPGLSALSSGAASVRADDGLCGRHAILIAAGGECSAFAPRASLPAG